MSVRVRIPTVFRKYTDQQSLVEVDSGTLSSVVDQLESRYPGIKGQLLSSDGELHRFVNVYVNDEDVRFLGGLETKLADGDSVTVLPAVAGGSS